MRRGLMMITMIGIMVMMRMMMMRAMIRIKLEMGMKMEDITKGRGYGYKYPKGDFLGYQGGVPNIIVVEVGYHRSWIRAIHRGESHTAIG